MQCPHDPVCDDVGRGGDDTPQETYSGASEDAWIHARKPRAHADGSILSAQAARLTMGVSANPTLLVYDRRRMILTKPLLIN